MTHPVDKLFAALDTVKPFPSGVVEITERISGTAFFPGGWGLWDTHAARPLPPMPTHGVMVLGHDFHSKTAFDESFRKGGEVRIDSSGVASSDVPTWTNLIRTLREFGIPPQRCFFTNVYMGLRASDKKTGRFEGSRDQAFVGRSREFFRIQLEAQQPKLILSLGAWVPRFLAPMADQLANWKRLNSLTAIDKSNPVRHEVTFTRTSAPSCSVVCLTHPSLRGPNVGRRAYGPLTGAAAECAMVKEGIEQSRVDLHVL